NPVAQCVLNVLVQHREPLVCGAAHGFAPCLLFTCSIVSSALSERRRHPRASRPRPRLLPSRKTLSLKAAKAARIHVLSLCLVPHRQKRLRTAILPTCGVAHSPMFQEYFLRRALGDDAGAITPEGEEVA